MEEQKRRDLATIEAKENELRKANEELSLLKTKLEEGTVEEPSFRSRSGRRR